MLKTPSGRPLERIEAGYEQLVRRLLAT